LGALKELQAVILVRTDTGIPATLNAHRGVHRDGTAIFLDAYETDKLLKVFILTDDEAVEFIKDLSRCLAASTRHMLAEELGVVR
jgi:hypothetical protein